MEDENVDVLETIEDVDDALEIMQSADPLTSLLGEILEDTLLDGLFDILET